jgi:hypothetical protein
MPTWIRQAMAATSLSTAMERLLIHPREQLQGLEAVAHGILPQVLGIAGVGLRVLGLQLQYSIRSKPVLFLHRCDGVQACGISSAAPCTS